MALVDYESSDEESEIADEKSEKVIQVQSCEKQMTCEPVNSGTENKSDTNGSIFLSLPKPKSTRSFLTDDNKLSNLLLNKKSISDKNSKLDKDVIKISVPPLSDFNDEEDRPVSKKPKVNDKNVGLFSILPPPKNAAANNVNKTFIPNSVSQIKKTISVNSKYFKKTKPVESEKDENDDDDIPVGTSFFGSSLTEQNKTGNLENVKESSIYEKFPVTNSEGPAQIIQCCENVSQQTYDVNSTQNADGSSAISEYDSQPVDDTGVQNNPLELDEKALQILCGGKKKRQQMPMNIIDLSGEEIMPDSKEWLLKQLTEERKVRSHSHRKSQGPSTQERRKHQITYLAFQAKEQELELQNQWANNRMSRRQTQSKYGF